MKYKANKNYHNNALDSFSGVGEKKHIDLKQGKAVELDLNVAKQFLDKKMLEEVKSSKGDK